MSQRSIYEEKNSHVTEIVSLRKIGYIARSITNNTGHRARFITNNTYHRYNALLKNKISPYFYTAISNDCSTETKIWHIPHTIQNAFANSLIQSWKCKIYNSDQPSGNCILQIPMHTVLETHFIN